LMAGQGRIRVMGTRNPWAPTIQDRLADRHGYFREIRRHVEELARSEQERVAEIGPFIAISREYGAGGCAVANRLGEALAWRVLDRDLLEFIAEQFRLDHEMLAILDENSLSWFGESLLSLIHPHLVSQDEYLSRLVKVVLVALAEAPGIVVGRGAHIFLPRRRGLAVRIVADGADRLARLQQERALDGKAAQRAMQDTDAARRGFVKRHFHCDVADPLAYDLVINTSRLGIDGAVALITAACKARGLAPTPHHQ
jgi:cytidylate kinase